MSPFSLHAVHRSLPNREDSDRFPPPHHVHGMNPRPPHVPQSSPIRLYGQSERNPLETCSDRNRGQDIQQRAVFVQKLHRR